MHPIIAKTFGGLSAQYYIRQLLFGLIFPALIYFMATQASSPQPMSMSMIAFLIINSVLYPYSRFVYESIIGFIMGENMFVVNALFMLVIKLFTMALCWCLAIFIAPVGLLYLYYHHSKSIPQD